MIRLPDWRLQLDAFLTSRLNVPFAWGENDCALFAADAIRAMTGVDLAEDLRGYTTVREAARRINASEGLAALVDKRLDGIPVEEARQGDVVMIPCDTGRHALAVVMNEKVAVGPSHDGMVVARMSTALRAWRV
jgi:hypothetical protein